MHFIICYPYNTIPPSTVDSFFIFFILLPGKLVVLILKLKSLSPLIYWVSDQVTSDSAAFDLSGRLFSRDPLWAWGPLTRACGVWWTGWATMRNSLWFNKDFSPRQGGVAFYLWDEKPIWKTTNYIWFLLQTSWQIKYFRWRNSSMVKSPLSTYTCIHVGK